MLTSSSNESPRLQDECEYSSKCYYAWYHGNRPNEHVFRYSDPCKRNEHTFRHVRTRLRHSLHTHPNVNAMAHRSVPGQHVFSHPFRRLHFNLLVCHSTNTYATGREIRYVHWVDAAVAFRYEMIVPPSGPEFRILFTRCPAPDHRLYLHPYPRVPSRTSKMSTFGASIHFTTSRNILRRCPKICVAEMCVY